MSGNIESVSNLDLECVFREHYADVVAFCRRRLPASDVDDVVAEVFATLWRREEDVDTAKARPWLFGVARNVIGTRYRAKERRQAAEGRLSRTRHLVVVPDHATEVAEADLVARAAALLSDADRELLELLSWEGLDTEELAIALDIRHATVHVRVHRLRERLHRHMNDLCIGHAARPAASTAGQ